MLDSKQAAHVQENRKHIRQGRLRTVTLVRKRGGATDYANARCTWKEEHSDAAGAARHSKRSPNRGPDVTAEFAPDVGLTDVVAIADTPDRTQVASARKYRVRERLHLGLTGTSNRTLVKLVAIR